jgi:hypothetical protein
VEPIMLRLITNQFSLGRDDIKTGESRLSPSRNSV